MITVDELVRAWKEGLEVEMVHSDPGITYAYPEGTRGTVIADSEDQIRHVASFTVRFSYARGPSTSGWSAAAEGLARLRPAPGWPGAAPAVDLSRYPHVCICGAPAYLGLLDTDCSKRCGRRGR